MERSQQIRLALSRIQKYEDSVDGHSDAASKDGTSKTSSGDEKNVNDRTRLREAMIMLMRAAKDAGIDIGDVADLHAERTGKRSASLDKEARKSKVQKKYDPNGTPS